MSENRSDEETLVYLERVLAPYHTQVGAIADVWAQFEQRLDQLIWDLADVEHPVGACITSQLNGPGPRFRVLKALLELREWPSDIRTRLNKLSHEIQVQQEGRNRAVHDAAFVGLSSETVYRRTVATVNNKLVFETVAHSLGTLKTVFEESRALLRSFNELQAEVRAFEPQPSLDKLAELCRRHGPPSEHRLTLRRFRRTPRHPPESSPD